MPISFKQIFTKSEHLCFLKEMKYNLNDPIDQINSNTQSFILHDAASDEKQTEMVKILLSKGKMDINMVCPVGKFKGQTPLHVALFHSSKKTAAFLISQEKIDLEQCDQEGECPLVKAVQAVDYENLQNLISADVNLDQENLISTKRTYQKLPYKHMTPLMYALTCGYTDGALLFIGLGAAVVNSQGTDALTYCLSQNILKDVNKEIKKQKNNIEQIYSILTNLSYPKVIATQICNYIPGSNCFPGGFGFFKPITKKRHFIYSPDKDKQPIDKRLKSRHSLGSPP